MEQQFYAACHRDRSVAKASSSGGAFSAITDQWYAQHGELAVVYGCAMDENLKAKHIRAEAPEERNRMRGSKYIGSDMTGILRMVAQDLAQGKYVAFSGTPCQIGGLMAFLNAKGSLYVDKLLTIEVICHGVGSVRFFNDYLHVLEKHYKSKAVTCSFRAKSRPGKKQDMAICFLNGKVYHASSTKYDWFYSAYLRNMILRPSCYQCKYACRERIADISIADHWGDAAGEMIARSLIIANTERGNAWVEAAQRDMVVEKISWEQVRQPHMQVPCMKPADYQAFWDCYRAEGYLSAQRFLGNNTRKGRLRSAAVTLLYHLHLIETAKYGKVCIKKLVRKR